MSNIEKVIEFLTGKYSFNQRVGIILGSGLDIFNNSILFSIEYREIPNMPLSTVPGHKGRLDVVKINNTSVIIMRGRYHLYEGYSSKDVVLPVEVLKGLGVEILAITNASGGINETYVPGDMMLIKDHINLTGENPLIGSPNFVDMRNAYSPRLREQFKEIGKSNGIELKEGVYVGVKGPTYETPAEIRFFRTIGGDAVGMSTVLEVIRARSLGMEVVGISSITNVHRDETSSVTHEEVLEMGRRISKNLEILLKEWIRRGI
ncbi:MAG: purine-nucleoside phosphorylase [bacterium]|nr:purine-nucleoside phosphorylase [bacterium]